MRRNKDFELIDVSVFFPPSENLPGNFTGEPRYTPPWVSQAPSNSHDIRTDKSTEDEDDLRRDTKLRSKKVKEREGSILVAGNNEFPIANTSATV